MISWLLTPAFTRAAYQADPASTPPWHLAPIWDGNGDEPPEGADTGNNDYDTLPNWYETLIGTDPFNPDTDGDGITDSDEVLVTGTNPLIADTDGNGWTDYEDWSGQSLATADPDGDGVNNETEIYYGMDPRNPDSDADGLGDGLEVATNGTFNPLSADTNANGIGDYNEYYNVPPPPEPTPSPDSDGDGLDDDQEAVIGTNPQDADTDDDGLGDGAEVAWGSSPLIVDTDGDSLSDAQEYALGLNPANPDTDGDGLSDGFEAGYNGGATYSPNSADSNNDGISDYQDYYGVPPPPPPPDSDGDGLPDDDESTLYGTDPNLYDTDGDGLSDGLEVTWGSNPNSTDSDGDEVPDATEYALGLNPNSIDSDNDGLGDNYEINISHTSAAIPDTDGDGLSDYYELFTANPPTDPLNVDSDGDFLTDFEEINGSVAFPGFTESLDPTVVDSDGDQIPDYLEVAAFIQDSDGGGIPDRIERFYGLNPFNAHDDSGDLDGDGWTNLQEYLAGHSLNSSFHQNYDWDADGMTNVWEIAHGLNPLDHRNAAEDPDGDWRPNLYEFHNGSDPYTADSGHPGTTSTGAPLHRGNDGPEWGDDWDGDGVNNLDELHSTDTDPTEPNNPPEQCSCGGSTCQCGTDPTCGAVPCEPPPSCTCGGSACVCGSPDACGGTACMPPACECGGNACSCSEAGPCSAQCNENTPCSCGGSECGCNSAGDCSLPCNPVSACVCSQVQEGRCGCPDANGCDGYGSCYTPPPCSCQWVGNGCTCATSDNCTGDCYTPPGCECQWNSADPNNNYCTCTSSGECNGDCYSAPGCECQYKDNGCTCSSSGGCNDDCQSEPSVDSVKATDTRGLAGNRSSTGTLKMVGTTDDGEPKAALKATLGGGPKPADQPTWSKDGGGDLTANAGNLMASWKGQDNVDVTADAPGGPASVKIEIVDPDKDTLKLTVESSGLKEVVEKVNDWMTRYSNAPKWRVHGGIEGSTERCDYYNDGERIGRKAKAEGTFGLSAPEYSTDWMAVPVPGLPSVTFTPHAKYKPFDVTAALSFNYSEEKADPWRDPVKGGVTVTMGVEGGGRVQWGVGKYLNVGVTGTATADVKVAVKFDNQGKKIRAATATIDIEPLILHYTVTAVFLNWELQVAEGDTQFWDAEPIPLPGFPKILYTIPD